MNTCRLNKLIVSFGCVLGFSVLAWTAASNAGPLTIEGDLNVTGNTTVSNLTVNGTNVIDAINSKIDSANVLRADGTVPLSGGLLPFEGTTAIRSTAADGADNSRLYLSGGGGALDVGRGAVISLSGNEAAGPGGGGKLSLWAGAGSNGVIELHTGAGGNNLGLIIDEDGNVGIGTNAPTVKLEVDGDVRAGVYYGDGSQLGGVNANPPATNSTTAEFQRDITVTGSLTVNRQDAVGEGGEIILKRAVDNAASWHLDDFYERLRFFKDGKVAMVVTPGGAVGIGTDNPETAFHIQGDAPVVTIKDEASEGVAARAYIRHTDNAGSDMWSVGDPWADSCDLAIVNARHANMRFYTDNDEKMRISSSGNVGIGTTTPAAKLDVDGPGWFRSSRTNDVGPYDLSLGEFVDVPEIPLLGIRTWDQGPGWSFTDIHSFRWGGQTRFSRGSPQGDQAIAIISGGEGSAGSMFVCDALGMATAKISGGEASYVPGALGIGTTTPAAKLDVNGDVKVAGQIILAAPAGDLSMGDFAN